MSVPPKVGEGLETSFSDGLLQIFLNRRSRRNALTRPMLEGLELLARWAGVEESVRAVMIAGRSGAFSAGDDRDGLGDALGVAASELTDSLEAHTPVVVALLKLRKPTVAIVEGPVFGAALDIALACDLRVGSPTTMLGPVYTSLGFVGGVTLLALHLGLPRARRILYLGQPIEAHQALELGLVDLIADRAATAAGEEWALRLASGPTVAFGLIKSLLLAGVGSGLLESLHREEEAILTSLRSEDGREGVASLAERRTATFTGK